MEEKNGKKPAINTASLALKDEEEDRLYTGRKSTIVKYAKKV